MSEIFKSRGFCCAWTRKIIIKITTWNCCLKLAKKADQLLELAPNIAVIQECEELEQDHFADRTFHWFGHNSRTGLGVLLPQGSAVVDKRFDNSLDYFMPLNLHNGMKLLGVWSFTHRAAGRFGEGHRGHVSDALEYYVDWLNDSDQGLICGDFNNSVIWDRGTKASNFLSTSKRLQELGFESVFHRLEKKDFGEENVATLYHTKQQNKPYHIDYIFCKGGEPVSCEIGSYDEWIALSDHMPVTAKIQF